MQRHWSAWLVLGLVASPAFAQYVAGTSSAIYPKLTSSSPIALQSPAGTSPNDRGRADIALGFTFPYYNRTYTQVTVTANGMVFLEPSSAANAASDFSFNFTLPNAGSEPRGIIAPFWDDLDGKNATSEVRRQAVSGAAHGQGIAIEWFDWSEHFGNYNLNFQVRLWQDGIVEFFYGDSLGSGGTVSATIGIESGDGARATMGKLCNQADAGTAGAACTLNDIPGDTVITFGPAPGPDLSVGRFGVDSIVTAGPNLTVTTTLLVRNFGTQPTGAFAYRIFLSDDTQYQAGVDAELTPTPRTMASIAALGSASSTVTGTVPRPATGNYYVLVVLDSELAVTETNENNNIGINGVPLGNGVDLVAENIVGPPLGGPGDNVTNTITFSNQGLDAPAQPVKVQILLSLDGVLDVTDRVVWEGNITVAGGQNVNQQITYVLPGSVAQNDYNFILVVDPPSSGAPNGAVPEISETNNVKVGSTRFTAMQADLIVEQVRVLRTDAPFNPASVAFFGESIRLEANIKNQGGASAPNVTVVFYLSDNETLNGITDPFIVDVRNLSLTAGQTQTITIDAPVPSRAVNMTPLAAAPYFFFGAIVGVGLNETTTTNNFTKAPPIRVRTPAPDLTATLIVGPSQIGAGEQMVVTRTLSNTGNRPASAVKYRYYLSANTIVTPNDVQLKIRTATGLVNENTVNLPDSTPNAATEVVEVPASTQPATYYLGVLLDPEGLIDEVDHDNNGLAGQLITVIAPGLTIDTPTLPDALLGGDYALQLSARGGDGMYGWAPAPGTMMPPGLSLSGAGVISGQPTLEGAYALTLRVTSGARYTDAVRVLRVVSATSSVWVTSASLPAPARQVPYEGVLSAAGGRSPYSWSLEDGVLPLGLILLPDGHVVGTTLSPLGAPFNFVVRVRDSVGNTDTRALQLVVVDGSALIITTYNLPAATVGSSYGVDIEAKNASMAPLSQPLTWSVSQGKLPQGLTLTPQDDKVVLSGTPKLPGNFELSIEVVDARGRSDSVDYVLEVRAPSIQVKGDVPDRVVRNQQVDVQFTVEGPVPDGVTWVIRDGVVPAGLTLEGGGKLTGVITNAAEYGHYSFTVGPSVDNEVVTFGSFSMELVDKIDPVRKCGCSGAEGLAPFALLFALAIRRRKSR